MTIFVLRQEFILILIFSLVLVCLEHQSTHAFFLLLFQAKSNVKKQLLLFHCNPEPNTRNSLIPRYKRRNLDIKFSQRNLARVLQKVLALELTYIDICNSNCSNYRRGKFNTIVTQ